VVRRTFTRWVRGERCCNDNRESLRMTLLSRESIVLWAWTSHAPYRRAFAAELRGRPHVRLRAPADVERWFAGFRPRAAHIALPCVSGGIGPVAPDEYLLTLLSKPR
jgi:hypothetical protein